MNEPEISMEAANRLRVELKKTGYPQGRVVCHCNGRVVFEMLAKDGARQIKRLSVDEALAEVTA